MKCSRIQRIVLECDEAELTAEILTHLEACPACGEHYRQACSCRRLIALKRYEIPPELRREACLGELHERLVYLQGRRDPIGYTLHPALRYGIAAAVVAMVAAHIAAFNGAVPLRSPVTQSDFRSRTFEQFVRDSQSPITGSLMGPQLFDTFPTFPTNAIPAKTRPASIFMIKD